MIWVTLLLGLISLALAAVMQNSGCSNADFMAHWDAQKADCQQHTLAIACATIPAQLPRDDGDSNDDEDDDSPILSNALLNEET